MKLPPMGDDLVRLSATQVPMLSSTWQANWIEAREQGMDVEIEDIPGRLVYDGQFVAAPALVGAWRVVNTTYDVDAWTPDMRREGHVRPSFNGLVLNDNGRTDNPIMLWSGDILLDLDKYQALQMRTRTIDGTEYLFVESGGFSNRHNANWRNGWAVLQRQ